MSAWANDMHARAREATGLYYPDSLHKAFLIHALDEIERLRAVLDEMKQMRDALGDALSPKDAPDA